MPPRLIWVKEVADVECSQNQIVLVNAVVLVLRVVVNRLLIEVELLVKSAVFDWHVLKD